MRNIDLELRFAHLECNYAFEDYEYAVDDYGRARENLREAWADAYHLGELPTRFAATLEFVSQKLAEAKLPPECLAPFCQLPWIFTAHPRT